MKNEKTRYSLSIADMQINVISDAAPEEIDRLVGILDRKMRDIHLKSYRCTKNQAALLCALEYCSEKLELQDRNAELEELAQQDAATIEDKDQRIAELEAELAKVQYQGALHLFPMPESQWRPKVYTCSSVAQTGLEEVWKGVEEYLDHIQANGYYTANRNRQNKYWMYESINESLRNSFFQNEQIETMLRKEELAVLNGEKTSFIAAKQLLDAYFALLH